MKSCPACNRTFEDTFTFCLIDGSILSAPFDPQATRSIPESRQTEPPPTVVMRHEEEAPQEIQPIIASPQPEQKREELVSTIAAPAPAFESPQLKASLAQPARSPSRSRLIIFGVVALLVFGIIFFVTNRTDSTNAVNKNSATPNTSPSSATNVSNSSAQGLGNGQEAQTVPSPSPIPAIELEETVWEGLMSKEYQRVYEFKTGGKVVEKAGGRAGVKTRVSTRIGSWTLQENRVSMKFPQTKTDVGMSIEATIQGIGHSEMTGDVKWEERPYMRDTIRVMRIR